MGLSVRRIGCLAAALLGAVCCWASLPTIAESTAPICAQAQQVIAGTKLLPKVVVHEDYEAFVESKATDAPFVVQQLFSNPDPDETELMRTVSCKMRTAERINTTHAGVAGELVAEGDQDCARVHTWLLDKLQAEIPASELRLDPVDVLIEAEQTSFMGPSWLDPWPFQAASMDEEGVLQLHSRALFVPRAWWIPLPERFQGNYYCHLVAPDYLRSVLRGQTRPQAFPIGVSLTK